MTPRLKILKQIAKRVITVSWPHPVRVAIDGVDAAGKTLLADELAPLIEGMGRPVIRASVDGFHNPRAVRYRQGADSPEGYYQDSYDHAAILEELLIPLGPGGARHYRRAVYDYRVDAPTLEPRLEAPRDAILLFDGVFLLRPELVDHWDFSIFLDVDFEISVPRAIRRDLAQSVDPVTAETLRAKYKRRYVPGQRIYLQTARPKQVADLVVDNSDFANPRLIRK